MLDKRATWRCPSAATCTWPSPGAAAKYATGFTNIMDLAFGRDGTLYVPEIRDSSLLSMTDTSGALWAVPRGGGTPPQIALPAGTLTDPGRLAVGRHHTFYVSNHGREAGAGKVLRILLLAVTSYLPERQVTRQGTLAALVSRPPYPAVVRSRTNNVLGTYS